MHRFWQILALSLSLALAFSISGCPDDDDDSADDDDATGDDDDTADDDDTGTDDDDATGDDDDTADDDDSAGDDDDDSAGDDDDSAGDDDDSAGDDDDSAGDDDDSAGDDDDSAGDDDDATPDPCLDDLDSDGVTACGPDGISGNADDDCDDNDPANYPGNTETCDAADNDCDGALSAEEIDDDGDGLSECDGDCDDLDPANFLGNTEVCDGADNDCDGSLSAEELDDDTDGVTECDGDCDDADLANFPGNPEVCDGQDNDCDAALSAEEIDDDTDGVTECDGDCDDLDINIFPGAVELCDDIDNNCDSAIDEDVALDASAAPALALIDLGTVSDALFVASDLTITDVDVSFDISHTFDSDITATITSPAGTSVLLVAGEGGASDNFTATVFDDEAVDPIAGASAPFTGSFMPEEALSAFDAEGSGGFWTLSIQDTAGGGTGTLNSWGVTVSGVGGGDIDTDGVSPCTDCNDDDINTFPGATELCDGFDNDCNGLVDADAEGEVDGDTDGSLSCDDCDDNDVNNFPGNPEICDAQDNDCDGNLGPDEIDDDTDGQTECDGDCDDADINNFDGNAEVCDAADNDCSGAPSFGDELFEDFGGDPFTEDDVLNYNVYSADSPVFLQTLSFWGGSDNVTAATGLVYVRDADPEPFELVTLVSIPTVAPAATPDWNESDPIDISLEPGREYLLGFFFEGTALEHRFILGAGASPSWGTFVGSFGQFPAVLPPPTYAAPAVIPGNAFPLRLQTTGEGDGDLDGDPVCSDCDDNDDTVDTLDLDADTVSSCDDDCDDNEPLAFPGNTETYYDGIDGDCAGGNDFDQDGDGFDSDAFGGNDCDDVNSLVYPYSLEDPTDSIDNDCDGLIDLADTQDVPVDTAIGDDSSQTVTLNAWTFPFCGTDWSEVGINSNGQLTFGFTHTDFSQSDAEFDADGASIAPLWDDLSPQNGIGVFTVDYGTALGVYWVDVPEFSTVGSNTFGVILEDTGRIILDYRDTNMNDALVGWSCGLDTEEPAIDISADTPFAFDGSLGTGTEDRYWELFASGEFDLDNQLLLLCGTQGVDGDNDGWTDLCGDPDDSNPAITP